MTSSRNTWSAAVIAAALISISGLAGAQPTTDPASASAPAGTPFAEGEIRKVDKENLKLTIKHGPLKNLDMPGMTMVFQVQDPAVLEKVQVGNKVQFTADKIDGKFTVIKLEAAR
ncbi:MAG: copper-binding protein [Hydrogenophaga sp.]|jgi:Cu/Ag efflux protein CusF|uniref:copper-binding protein n=1 Tax=Hydrogenophaga sp. TaxID=1904254 RepID=UPI001D4F903E|nr:copper-binding protein [Hydrogenophaga sp.]MBW0171034.1 copper-binding protein [Hydrogenophaga sp.]MBW0183843.1 copper-binding protein [Hydrogenophaga sp.]